MIRRIATLLLLIIGFFLAGPAPAAAGTKHTVKVSKRAFVSVGHHVKLAAKDVVHGQITLGTVQGFLAAISAFDAAVIDPTGVAFQMGADFLDMNVAQPLEKLPEPFEGLGDGVHYAYLGLDKVGQVLAR